MPTSDISIHDLFDIIDEHRIYEFCKQHAFTNKAFADALRKHFANDLPSPKKKMTLNEIKKMVDRCFTHEYDRPQFYNRYHDYEPEYQNWYAVGKDLEKVIKQLDLLIDNRQPSLAIDGALYLIKKVCNQYEEDYCYEREDIDYEDLHLEDAIETIRNAFECKEITPQQKLSAVAQLEKLSHSEPFEYESFGSTELIEDTRDLLMTDDERITLREDAFHHAQGEYERESRATELWDYLLTLNRPQQAIAFYHQHKKIPDLRTRYVRLLLQQENYDEALTTLNEGIRTLKGKAGITLDWQRTKLTIFERQDDTLSIISQLQLLFIEDSNTMVYYCHLKKLIPTSEWPTFLTALLKKRDFGNSATSTLSEIYASEQWYDRLFTHLMRADYHLLSAIEQYIRLFNEDQQAQLVQRLDTEFRNVISRTMTRKEYNDYTSRLIRLRNTCPPGKALADTIVSHCRQTYRNRPAMLDELKRYDK